MKPNEIKLSDWARILLGDVPPEFYLELVIRAFFIYFLLMLGMRMMGKRMASQVSRLELVAMTALASAIGVPILAPERGLLPAVIIVFIVVWINRTIARMSIRNERVERATQGELDILLEHSVLRWDVMQRVRITRERLFSHLRAQKVTHLGTIERMYMEADGHFTIIRSGEEQPGLSILPEWDTAIEGRRHKGTGVTVCRNCGIRKEGNAEYRRGHERCRHCGGEGWTNAVKLAVLLVFFLAGCSKMADYESPKGVWDRQFAVSAAYVNLGMESVGQAAAADSSLAAFGRALVLFHTAAQRELQLAADTINLVLPVAADGLPARVGKRLTGLAVEMDSIVNLFNSELKNGTNEPVLRYARGVLPGLEAERRTVDSLLEGEGQ